MSFLSLARYDSMGLTFQLACFLLVPAAQILSHSKVKSPVPFPVTLSWYSGWFKVLSPRTGVVSERNGQDHKKGVWVESFVKEGRGWI